MLSHCNFAQQTLRCRRNKTPRAGASAETFLLAFVTKYIRELGVNEDMRALTAR